MLSTRTNIHEKLRHLRDKECPEQNILDEVQRVLDEDRFRESAILQKLGGSMSAPRNDFDIDQLESDRVFHLSQIKKICISNRLRFLDTKYFKGNYPQSALAEIKYLENKHETKLDGFKIIAPSKMFVLLKTDDPVLFAPIGNDYYYVIDRWGNDLHPLRKLQVWPFKSFENLALTLFLVSILATLLVPDGLFTKEQSVSKDVMVFFFMFKSIAAVVIFYGFALGKNFNTAIWNRKFDKS
jgi:hypothetical protein